MKTTIVPAQITTVEDKITSNLSFTQLLLLITPVFMGGAVFILLPPFLNYAWYKLLVIGFVALICITLAIRIKERLILQWIRILAAYNMRPKWYVFNKNTAYLRDMPEKKEAKQQKTTKQEYSVKKPKVQPVRLKQVYATEVALANTDSDFSFTVTKKGVLSARVKKVS